MTAPGQAQSGEFPPEFVRAKGIMAGATTLEEAASKVRVFADSLDELAAHGWELAIPVGDDYAFLREPEQ